MVAVQVKICGIRDPEAARACAAAGVDYAGLNFVSGSRRIIGTDRAVELLPLLGETCAVGVFRDAPVARVRATAEELGLTWVQLHGRETPDDCRRLATGLRVVKAITAAQVVDDETLRAFAASVSALLVDGREPGSGRPWCWGDLTSAFTEVPGMLAGVPWWLAGGLDPDNVAAGIATLRPAGVDTATGVERDGRTDPGRIAAFCRSARRAAAGGAS